jgi:F0F1-type ATP synthase assembly protein I
MTWAEAIGAAHNHTPNPSTPIFQISRFIQQTLFTGRRRGDPLISGAQRVTATPPIDPEAKKMWRIAGTTGAVGIEIAAAIGIGYLGGHYLDHKLGTQPWIGYIGLLAGIGAAVKALVRVTRAYKREQGDGGGSGDDRSNKPGG